MRREFEYSRNYLFLVLQGVEFPQYKKEEKYRKYKDFVDCLKANGEQHNLRLYNFMVETRKSDIDSYLEKIVSN
jgi:hypothetical protein